VFVAIYVTCGGIVFFIVISLNVNIINVSDHSDKFSNNNNSLLGPQRRPLIIFIIIIGNQNFHCIIGISLVFLAYA